MSFELSADQIEHWRQILRDSQADHQYLEHREENRRKWASASEGILGLVDRYLAGQIDLERFRSIFDCKTRTEWDIPGFKGLSGAMVLNVLVKHVEDRQVLDQELKQLLPVPIDEHTGRDKMRRFMGYQEDLIRSGQMARTALAPGRTAFFASAFWYVQNPEEWPLFFPETRRYLATEGLYQATGDPVTDYFAFREVILSIATALRIQPDDVQHLEPPATPGIEINTSTVVGASESHESEGPAESTHTHVQWMLAKIAKKVGCQVWIATNDQNKAWHGERLGDLGVKTLPSLGIDPDSQRAISLIDVLWTRRGGQVVAAFEVEQTTSIYSGLLRMSDLTVLSPSLSFPLYIVASEQRLEQVRRELSRPTFQFLELHKRCGYFSAEALEKEFDNIIRYANDPSVIEILASRVGDISLLAA